MAHTRDVVWCCCLNRRWKQCRNQNRLALLLCLRTLLGTGTVRAVDVVLILHVSLTTKISDVIYHYFNIFPPWRQRNREARSTALQPIRLITRRVVLGRDCILFCHKPRRFCLLSFRSLHVIQILKHAPEFFALSVRIVLSSEPQYTSQTIVT